MKSEERHQLLTNDLGVVTNKAVGFFERHLEAVIAAACAVLVIAAVVFWWSTSTDTETVAGWTMLDSAKNLQEMGIVADKFKGKAPGQWAALKSAEKICQDALPMMFTNRERAKSDLKTARESFELLAKDKSAPPAIRERALWGMALCLETVCEGDTAKPIEAYQGLLTSFPESIFRQVAEERIVSLKKDDAKEFYEWFSKENPKPAEAQPDEFKKSGINLPSPKSGDDDMDDAEEEKMEQQSPAADKPQDSAQPGDNAEQKPADPAKPVEGEKSEAAPPAKDGEKPAENK